MRDGRAAHAGLVRKDAAADADADSAGHREAGHAAGGRLQAEGGFKDAQEGLGKVGAVGDDDPDGKNQIKDGHEGNEDAGKVGDALDAAADDEHHENDKHQPHHKLWDAEIIVQRGGDRVGLGHAADAKGGEQAENGEEGG